ncbi:YD repeat-containing protein [Reichenbachiella faecimaris]|uniref:YD repeat-containing protein n=1 Tax=Reichenbachiella faecimaris TaxID=692418 RepID=A0A1W2GMT4_REIFA|nr:DUF6443 domain-containing protein [Reichenbachiella faecimaris]SMD37973.1 YD repeat-containing protein [Reichenbachiella faecimaris]
MKKIILISILVWFPPFVWNETFGQESENTQEIIEVPSSPNAAHLGTYGEVGVGKNTGSANVSVPILNVEEGGVSIPISLSYQSAGLRVDERPSWVGLGWVLNGGGVISRTMRGRCDDMHGGFLHNAKEIPNDPKIRNVLESTNSPLSEKNNLYDYLNQLSSGNKDFIPDNFSYNFTGHCGSFFLGNEGYAHIVDYEGLKIKPKYGIDSVITTYEVILGWTVVDENGLIYEFDEYETTRVRTKMGWEQKYISSWHLSTIYNPITGTTASFLYDSPSSFTYEDWTKTFTYVRSHEDPQTTIYRVQGEPKMTYQRVIHENLKFLSEINIGSQKIKFYNSLSEEETDGSIRNKKLDQIEWTTIQGNSKKFAFNYNYFTSSSTGGDKRLKLLSLIEGSGTSTRLHSFEYYEPKPNSYFPPRHSYDQDHWGFYNLNGTKNKSLVPDVLNYAGQNLICDGANREPWAASAKLGMLKTITYPTSGSSTFSYEENTVQDTKKVDDVIEIIGSTSISATGVASCSESNVVCEPSDWLVSASQLKSTNGYKIIFSYDTFFSGSLGLPDCGKYPVFKIRSSTSSQPIYQKSLTESGEDYFVLEDTNKGYSFELCIYGDDATASVNLQLEETDYAGLDEIISRPIGGLRLSKIENEDPQTNIIQTRTFDYGYGGYKVWHDPNYAQVMTYVYPKVDEETNGEEGTGSISGGREPEYVVTIGPSPAGGLGPSSLPVAYEMVVEYLGTKTTNIGKIETVFFKNIDSGTDLTIQVSQNAFRSKVKEQSYYDNFNVLKRQEKYIYDPQGMGFAQGFRVKKLVETVGGDRDYEFDFYYANFILANSWWRLKSKQTIDFTSSGQFSNMVSYEYTNNMHTNPTKQITNDSQGNELITEYIYPFDRTLCDGDTYIYLNEYTDALKACHLNTDSRATYETCAKAAISEYKNMLDNFDDLIESKYNSLYTTDPYQAAIEFMNLSNIKSKPIEVKFSKGSMELSRTINLFKMWELDRFGSTNKLALLQSKSTSFQGNIPKLQVTVNDYDARANPIEIEDKNGITTSYVWDNYGQYLKEKIVNVSLAEVIDSFSDEYSFRDQPALADALITSYTSKPGIGITSQTNPDGLTTRYEYDELNRLKYIIDNDNNVVKRYDYNYSLLSNYVYDYTARKEMDAIVKLSSVQDVSKTYNYYDGFGRLKLQVQNQASSTQKNILQPKIYDKFGRESVQYLPYVSSGSSFAEMELLDFYSAANDGIANDERPFSETTFDDSPLNRTVDQTGPGKSWNDEGATVNYDYTTNAEDEVIFWQISAENKPIDHQDQIRQYYAAGELYKNVTSDEQAHEVQEFVDKQGRTILKRVQAHETGESASWLNTYYVYDDLGNLRFVIPPKASKL